MSVASVHEGFGRAVHMFCISRKEERMDTWRIAIYGNSDDGDDDLIRVSEQLFDSREVAQFVVIHLETLDRYSEFDFVVREWRPLPPAPGSPRSPETRTPPPEQRSIRHASPALD